MKKYILHLVLIACTTGAFGQTKGTLKMGGGEVNRIRSLELLKAVQTLSCVIFIHLKTIMFIRLQTGK